MHTVNAPRLIVAMMVLVDGSFNKVIGFGGWFFKQGNHPKFLGTRIVRHLHT